MPRKSAKARPAASRNQQADDVDALIAALNHPLEPEIQMLRTIIRGADSRIAEGVKWNAPSFYTSEHFATFHLRAKDGVQVILHLGAKPRPDAAIRESIADPGTLLQWRGADRAIVTFRDRADITAKADAFAELIREWIEFVE
jgi:hypothetical protein